MRQFDGYASPSSWGEWKTIGEYSGSLSFSISAKPIGDVVIRSQVKYWKRKDEQVEEEFMGSTSIITANVYGNVEVRFMGLPLGTVISGTINP
jgi:hypothetical protein